MLDESIVSIRLPDVNEPRASASVADVGRVGREAPAAQSGVAGPQRTDTVHLSGLAGRISDALSPLAGDHLQRIQRLMEHYQAGGYSVPSMEIGRAMIAGSLKS